jgi:hypothetical protein
MSIQRVKVLGSVSRSHRTAPAEWLVPTTRARPRMEMLEQRRLLAVHPLQATVGIPTGEVLLASDVVLPAGANVNQMDLQWPDGWCSYGGSEDESFRVVTKPDGKIDIYGSHTFSSLLSYAPPVITAVYRNPATGSWDTFLEVPATVAPNKLSSVNNRPVNVIPGVDYELEIARFPVPPGTTIDPDDLTAEITLYDGRVLQGMVDAFGDGSIRVSYTGGIEGELDGDVQVRLLENNQPIGQARVYLMSYKSVGIGATEARREGDELILTFQPAVKNRFASGFSSIQDQVGSGKSTLSIQATIDNGRRLPATIARQDDGSYQIVVQSSTDFESAMVRIYETYVGITGEKVEMEHVGSFSILQPTVVPTDPPESFDPIAPVVPGILYSVDNGPDNVTTTDLLPIQTDLASGEVTFAVPLSGVLTTIGGAGRVAETALRQLSTAIQLPALRTDLRAVPLIRTADGSGQLLDVRREKLFGDAGIDVLPQ